MDRIEARALWREFLQFARLHFASPWYVYLTIALFAMKNIEYKNERKSPQLLNILNIVNGDYLFLFFYV